MWLFVSLQFPTNTNPILCCIIDTNISSLWNPVLSCNPPVFFYPNLGQSIRYFTISIMIHYILLLCIALGKKQVLGVNSSAFDY